MESSAAQTPLACKLGKKPDFKVSPLPDLPAASKWLHAALEENEFEINAMRLENLKLRMSGVIQKEVDARVGRNSQRLLPGATSQQQEQQQQQQHQHDSDGDSTTRAAPLSTTAAVAATTRKAKPSPVPPIPIPLMTTAATALVNTPCRSGQDSWRKLRCRYGAMKIVENVFHEVCSKQTEDLYETEDWTQSPREPDAGKDEKDWTPCHLRGGSSPCAVEGWGKVRRSMASAAVMNSLLSHVRERQSEEVYESDWNDIDREEHEEYEVPDHEASWGLFSLLPNCVICCCSRGSVPV
eukprot:TRINITY_DN8880_c0_g3_i3.p1 TRINITY_DN8880_c0_g3~~TRINITY_DN8880_c0_g3_i3.p1  ORF type:complete len:316 (+),score=54.57 TRINITY_DN8880_c0_g3_i3:62-949(+)